MNVVLCGMDGCGKTTIGKKISEKLNIPFMDTDQLIEQAYAANGEALSCREIFRKEGAEAFRKMEKEQVINLNPEGTTILATGGGTLDDPESLEFLKKYGTLIYLKCSLDVIWERMQKSGIPAYLDHNDAYNDLLKVFLKRSSFYEKAANGIVNCHKLTPEEIVWEITNLAPFLKSSLGANLTAKPSGLSSTGVLPGLS
jgi:shikimate kinase